MSILEYYLGLEKLFLSHGFNVTNINLEYEPDYTYFPDDIFKVLRHDGTARILFECSDDNDDDSLSSLVFIEDPETFKSFELMSIGYGVFLETTIENNQITHKRKFSADFRWMKS